MAVTLHLSPPSVAYSRQPIAVSILTDNIAVGQQAYIALIFSAQGCIEGDVLVLKWSGKTCSFLFRALPDTSGNQLPVFTGTDFSYYVAFQLRDALASNGAINDDFVIEKGVPNQISLVHRATTAVTITTIGSVVHNLVFNVFNIA